MKKKIKYKHIWAWAQLLGSLNYYPRIQAEQAEKDNAPIDVIYKDEKNKWYRAQDIQSLAFQNEVNELARKF